MFVLIRGIASLRFVNDKPVRLSPRATVVLAVALLITVMQAQTARSMVVAAAGMAAAVGTAAAAAGTAAAAAGMVAAEVGTAAVPGTRVAARTAAAVLAALLGTTAAGMAVAAGTAAAAGMAAVPGTAVAGTKAGTAAVTAGGGWSRALAGTVTTRQSTPTLTPTHTHRSCLQYPIGITARTPPVTTPM
jgi:hypothetical protein